MTSYVDPFTGGVVQPSNVAYRAVSISADYAPVWPSKAADTPEVVANLMEVTATVANLLVTLPPANEVGNGTTVIWRNTGAQTFTLVDQSGNTIQALTAGQIWAVYLQDNSTTDGTWASFQFSATTSLASPGPLAGNGLVAITTTLNTAHPVVSTASSGYTTAASDRAELLTWTGGAGSINLQSVATAGNNFFFLLRNAGSGTLTVTPSGADTIDGNASLTLNPTESCFLVCSGSAWHTVGQGRSITVTVTQLIKPVGGAVNVTLTAAEAANQLLQFTGVLTGNISVIVPTNVATYHVFNNTTGAFSLTVRTAAGTGVIVVQGTRVILDCDGTNVVNANSAAAGTVTTINVGTGLTATPSPITTSGTISLANTAVTPGTYFGPAITVDQQGRLTAASTAAAPQITVLGSGSGTYTTPANATRIEVRAVGGGGGGGGAGTGATAGGNGGNTTFGTMQCNGGQGGSTAGGTAPGGTVVNADFPVTGATGQISYGFTSTFGSPGGVSPFGGNGAGGAPTQSGLQANGYGSGGGGGGSGSTVNSGGGGAGGGYGEKTLSPPAASYGYAVGSAGAAGVAGTNGGSGASGATGIIIVTAYFS